MRGGGGGDMPLITSLSGMRKCPKLIYYNLNLQARLDRQALEINYLKNGSDAASMFRRAKSFTAKDKKTFVSLKEQHYLRKQKFKT